MESVEGLSNSQVKFLRDLKKNRGQKKAGRFIIEGRREVLRAIQNRMPIETLYYSPQASEFVSETIRPSLPESIPAHRVTDSNFRCISLRENPDGILAVSARPTMDFPQTLGDRALITVLESIEKPGNLGAIARTIDAVGGDLLIIAEPVCDPWNPNAIRSSQGSIFSVPVIQCSNVQALDFLNRSGVAIFATSPRADTCYWDQDYPAKMALVFGNENRGLSNFWFENSTKNITIPQRSTTADSLNVTVAASLCLFEVLRSGGCHRGS